MHSIQVEICLHVCFGTDRGFILLGWLLVGFGTDKEVADSQLPGSRIPSQSVSVVDER